MTKPDNIQSYNQNKKQTNVRELKNYKPKTSKRKAYMTNKKIKKNKFLLMTYSIVFERTIDI